MSLLIQTSVLIMVIALITYSRLELYLPKKALEQEIVNFMSHTERDWMNRYASVYYDSLHPEKKGLTNEDGKPPKEQPKGTGQISLRPLFEESTENLDNTRVVLRNLLSVLYEKQPFVLNAVKNGGYPDASSLFNELIETIIQIGKNQQLEDRPKTDNQFKQLDLGSFQSLFVNIVNGCSACVEEGEAVEGDSGDVGSVVPRNYCSLFSFANLQPYKLLSVYLAPEETLMALYGNPQIVSEIIQARTAAYKEYKNNPTPESQAALERFKSVPAAIDSKHLEFRVTGTNPNRKRATHS